MPQESDSRMHEMEIKIALEYLTVDERLRT